MPAGEEGQIHPTSVNTDAEGIVKGVWHTPWVIIMAAISLPIWAPSNCSLLGYVQQNTSGKEVLEI